MNNYFETNLVNLVDGSSKKVRVMNELGGLTIYFGENKKIAIIITVANGNVGLGIYKNGQYDAEMDFYEIDESLC